MNKYYIYTDGTFDEKERGYRRGVLDSVHDSEMSAFMREKELRWQYKQGVYMRREGDPVFAIVQTNVNGLTHLVVDVQTKTHVAGACTSLEEAIECKKWCEEYHYIGGAYMDEYYRQFNKE